MDGPLPVCNVLCKPVKHVREHRKGADTLQHGVTLNWSAHDHKVTQFHAAVPASSSTTAGMHDEMM